MQHEDSRDRHKMCQKTPTLCPIVSVQIRHTLLTDDESFLATFPAVQSQSQSLRKQGDVFMAR
jgi:hypothetical protein